MILGQVVNQVLGGVDLSQGKLVVVSVIEDIDQLSIEWMNILQNRVRKYLYVKERRGILYCKEDFITKVNAKLNYYYITRKANNVLHRREKSENGKMSNIHYFSYKTSS